MAARKSRPSLADRTPVAEWTAAALGLVMTLGVVGYTLWEGLTEDPGPPRLTVTAQTATPNGATHVVPIVVRNASHATAAQVEVRAVLRSPAGVSEERRASFAYVPGRGEARGGLVFRQNPAGAELDLSIEGYAEP
ncbi:MAG: hypothetical protein A2790_02245 [Phenylobacterium sp. RIFCSPHIGHO2_01_FULL_69_31]|jgi:uncharacterized protein (TIGR02588 family)|uniref:hypothetical protein n=1 Tax=Phenylobacterium sp. RIFCSPHIGHO2_01_FULL_69_31 TaxID=1801944 RepID=UPI0008C3EDA2|nr:hypothetical protein [Phenylobacterium sp. RIFCSPHIGHO2_01_FULL_69_31]OHB31357.1 MAG: hypothetical protein A2790_02245 [Phenylobacterium sp. RIFCSPHIGHO2_01_FULL_69_31]